MTAKDWFDVIFAVGTIALAAIASFYTHNRAKIDTKTATGKAIDTVGKLAVWAVNEAEYTGMTGAQKREYAAEVITEQLRKKGVTDITESTVYGAIQAAWSAANFDHEDTENKDNSSQNVGDAGQVMDDAPVAAKEGEVNGN
ncbi:hypothetical protein lacNasYZ03_08210 [Lactobacillus nasalidis]|uniref:Phage holin n=1 Tax=Lactobacillus nasalidis TaxID=2797258 RepID=A0ABQ3W7Q9_9LACO|nr:phage holin [Lactobacillus nasalidis]GHV97314.1 hypothetical protein lacNasYZ01_04960 [Lactobacillus nasalidis]GHV99910.1 hypothetical protein lacNasYZ02_13400 [Lactobacillus nasalidis]GHW01134.1 hypothetical protein lacNasYZ03_08210 [Lactobacillus nasalidis]